MRQLSYCYFSSQFNFFVVDVFDVFDISGHHQATHNYIKLLASISINN